MNKDKFGPEVIVEIYDPKLGMEGYLVIDNTTLGPGKGGVRMHKAVSKEEVFRLARTMTWKNALAGIPFGGAKAGIVWNGGDPALKKKFMQKFAEKVGAYTPNLYITGPDVNTGEEEMRWFVEKTGNWKSATGKPRKMRGLPHELGSTGFGVAHSALVAAKILKMKQKGATVAIHGFGNVGTFTYKFLKEAGMTIVALADSRNAIYNKDGLDTSLIDKFIDKGTRLEKYPEEFQISPEKFWGLQVDVLIPASITDVINDSNKNSIRARMIVEGANIPMREDVEKELADRGILVIPDFVANAGGVISSYAEYKGMGVNQMFKMVEKKISESTKKVVRYSLKKKLYPRDVAMEMAEKIVWSKMKKAK